MTIAIYGRAVSSAASAEALLRVVRKLEKSGADVLLYEPFLKSAGKKIKAKKVFTRHSELRGKAKFLFSIGGDGTLLETLTLVRDSQIPVMGINTGRLGFLSSISSEEIEPAVDSVLGGNYSLDKRMLLQLDVKGKLFGDCKFALNEIAVQKTESSAMITIHASLNGKFLNSYWADGLIVATPTGSTAYSLSCGGPIVMPDSDNLSITPIAPHNLNVRPVIISSGDVITLEVEGRNPNFLLSLDSRAENIQSAGKLTIRKAKFLLSLVKLENHDFLSTLRNKLMWGADKRN
ncbi:MAG: NAD kinase [Bacteroidetes bacterium]|nr:NAD kinase [Bacteroidota bacterium]